MTPKTKIIIGFTFIISTLSSCLQNSNQNSVQSQPISSQIDTAEFSNFEIDLSITNFKHISTSSNFYFYSENKNTDTLNGLPNAFFIEVRREMTEKELENNFQEFLTQSESAMKFYNKTIVKSKINTYTVWVLETKMISLDNKNKEGIMYYAMIVGNKKSIRFVGTAYNNLDDYLKKYKQTLETIKIK